MLYLLAMRNSFSESQMKRFYFCMITMLVWHWDSG